MATADNRTSPPPAPGRCRSPALVAILGLALAVGPEPLLFDTAPAAAQSASVSIVDFGFAPASVQATMVPAEIGFLQPHAHVGFANNGAVAHSVTFDDTRVPSSPTLNPNQFFDAVITIAGTFTYHCSIHPSMEGRITVAPLPTTTTTAEAPTTAVPTTSAPTTPTTAASTTTTRPRQTTTTTRPAAGAATTTTVAAGTTVAPAPTVPAETTTIPVTEPPSTSATTAAAAGRADAAAREPASDSRGRSVPVLLLLLLGGGGLFVGRTVWLRRRGPLRT